MPMYNPSHPGRIVRSGCLEPLGLSVTAGAKALGVSRQALSSLVNGRARVTPEMAVRLAKAFDTNPELWIRMQAPGTSRRCASGPTRSRSSATVPRRWRWIEPSGLPTTLSGRRLMSVRSELVVCIMSQYERQEKVRVLLRGAQNLRGREFISDSDFRVMVRHAMVLDVTSKLQPHVQRQNSQVARFKRKASERLDKLRLISKTRE